MAGEPQPGERRLLVRWVYAGIGILATGLAVLGAILPGLPTTIFVIVALWCFANSSDRLMRWLRSIPLLRVALQEAERYGRDRTIHPRVKWIAQSFAWGSFLLVTLLLQNWIVSLCVGLAALGCTVFMVLSPSSRTAPAETVMERPDPEGHLRDDRITG